jgi:hypothetical protein
MEPIKTRQLKIKLALHLTMPGQVEDKINPNGKIKQNHKS